MSDQMMSAGVSESSTWLCSVDVRRSPQEQADVLRSAFPSASTTVMGTREQELLRILLPWLSVLLWVLAVAGPLLFALVLSLAAAGLLGHSRSACLPAFFALTLGYLLIVVLLPSLLLADFCYRRL